jgi:hypothetical protein
VRVKACFGFLKLAPPHVGADIQVPKLGKGREKNNGRERERGSRSECAIPSTKLTFGLHGERGRKLHIRACIQRIYTGIYIHTTYNAYPATLSSSAI